MQRTEYVIPSVRMRARDEQVRRAARYYPVLEPFGPRHCETYFNNRKEDSATSAYERLHTVVAYDPRKPRCDRANRNLYWLEIYKENQAHAVPMTSNHWYGRPNRALIDPAEKRFNRSSKMRDFYSSNRLHLMIVHGNGCEVGPC